MFFWIPAHLSPPPHTGIKLFYVIFLTKNLATSNLDFHTISISNLLAEDNHYEAFTRA